MSASISCDHCGKTAANIPDDTLTWLVIGWHNGEMDDACSINCARAMVDEYEQIQVEWEKTRPEPETDTDEKH